MNRVFGMIAITALASISTYARTPYSESDLKSVENATESKVHEIRDQEIAQLRIALGRRSPINRRADLYYRLAEIYVEAYRSTFILEGRVHQRRLEAHQEDKFIDQSHSKPYLSSAIKACKEILGFGISYPKMDQIYYFLAFSSAELGDSQDSVRYYTYLIEHFSSSPFASEGYRELGENAFQTAQFHKAQTYFESAVKTADPQSAPRILHRLAWSYYRTKQYGMAVDTMKRAIQKASQSDEKFLSLREEALKDAALFMTEYGKVDEALEYFGQVASDKNYYPKILGKLGKEYERAVEPVKATYVYESLLKIHPEGEASFRVLVKLVDLDLRRGKYREALTRLKGITVPKEGEPDTVTAAQNLRAMIRRTATEHHEEYRKKNDRASLEIAELYYGEYLVLLAQSDSRNERPEIEMYLAEVKRDLGKSGEASALYRKVVESRDKRYAKEAGALWTASLAEAIKKAGAKSEKATEPSQLEKEFIDAADRLQESLGNTPEGREASLRAAQVLAGYPSAHKESIKRIKKVIDMNPRSAQALTAAHLWVQIYTDQPESNSEAMDSLHEVSDELRSNHELMSADQESGGGKLKTLLSDLETRFRVNRIAKDEKEKNFSKAGKDYESFAKDASQRDAAEKAYANAILSYSKEDDKESIERVSVTWLRRYPSSPKAIESQRAVATALLVQGELEASGKVFERLGSEAGDSDSLETAARLFASAGDESHSRKIQSEYLERYPKSPHKYAIAMNLGKSLEKTSQDSEASKAYQFCMSGPPAFEAECGVLLAKLYFKNKDIERGRSILSRVSTLSSKSKSPYIGYARYLSADLNEKSQRFDEMAFPESELKRTLNQRLQFLESLNRNYLAVVDAGGPWAIAALNRLALWVSGFADEIDQIPPPAGTPEQITKLKKSLSAISEPLRKKANATWSDGYSKAVGAGVLSPALPEIADHLADARISGMGRAQGGLPNYLLAGPTADLSQDRIKERMLKPGQSDAAQSSVWVEYGNYLWQGGKPALAKIAFERALALDSKNAAALNNMGAAISEETGQDHWISAIKALQYFESALEKDSFLTAAKVNQASLLNYYRLFGKAKSLWEQAWIKLQTSEVQDGLAVSLQGLGRLALASSGFEKATDLGAKKSRFTNVYHQAARFSLEKDGGSKCLDRLSDLDEASLKGFEAESVTRLKRVCSLWKKRF